MRLRSLALAGSTALVALAGFAWLSSAAALDSGFDPELMLAQATPPAAAPPPAGRERRMAVSPNAMCLDMVARRVGNRAYIEARLDLKPDPVPRWNAFEKAADEASARDKARCTALPDEMKTPPTYIDRLTMREEWLKARLASLEATKPSLQALYAALTPEQKAVFDRPMMGGHHHHHGMGPR
jgi:hypothetical protein